MKRKPLPIGIEDFKKIISEGYYYADKTLAIKDIVDSKAAVTLFTRPRRFGKTLFQKMLKTFFEDEKELLENNVVRKIDNSRYFEGLRIMDAGEGYLQHQGKYPVVFLSLKSAKQPNFRLAFKRLKDEITREYKRNMHILCSGLLLDIDKKKYMKVINEEMEDDFYMASLKFLSDCMYKATGQKVIILIDEYDVPLENSYDNGFYDEMISFIRSLFESALKTNDSLEFAVLTGCLRVSKESIFTGLNNLKTISVLSDKFDEYFGFTQQEVDEALNLYGLQNRRKEVKDWYDGYLFGSTEVYNPWSIINYMDDAADSPNPQPIPYWANSSSNSIIHEIIKSDDTDLKDDIELLMSGKTIEAYVHLEITYADIHNNTDSLWNFLLFTGYLKAVKKVQDGDEIKMTMCIPNREVNYIYKNSISTWFEKKVETLDLSSFLTSMENADTETMGEIVQGELLDTISYLDSKESFYHGFFTGLLKSQKKYKVISSRRNGGELRSQRWSRRIRGGLRPQRLRRQCTFGALQRLRRQATFGDLQLSNRESGEGRYDLVLKNRRDNHTAYIFELKEVDHFEKMEKASEEALSQIDEKKYEHDLKSDGYKIAHTFAVVFSKKRCLFKAK